MKKFTEFFAINFLHMEGYIFSTYLHICYGAFLANLNFLYFTQLWVLNCKLEHSQNVIFDINHSTLVYTVHCVQGTG